MIPNRIEPVASPTSTELEEMHEFYCGKGQKRGSAPHAVYDQVTCPHEGCSQRLQPIRYRLEDHGKQIHDELVKAWWEDTGFAERCPSCQGWIHFTIRGKAAIDESEANKLPKLPDNWSSVALVL